MDQRPSTRVLVTAQDCGSPCHGTGIREIHAFPDDLEAAGKDGIESGRVEIAAEVPHNHAPLQELHIRAERNHGRGACDKIRKTTEEQGPTKSAGRQKVEIEDVDMAGNGRIVIQIRVRRALPRLTRI